MAWRSRSRLCLRSRDAGALDTVSRALDSVTGHSGPFRPSTGEGTLRNPIRSTAPAVLAVALVGLGLQTGAVSADADEELALVERATSDKVIDLGDKGDSAGDILTFADPVYDAKNETQVGSDSGWCVRIVAGQSWECTSTTILQTGQITVHGPFYDTKDSVLAVTGGTGAFANVRGEMVLHARDAQGSAYDLVFKLRK